MQRKPVNLRRVVIGIKSLHLETDNSDYFMDESRSIKSEEQANHSWPVENYNRKYTLDGP